MNFTCKECNDTGSRDKSGDYLDCPDCDAPTVRAELETWLHQQRKETTMGLVHSADAWAIHQRALAMVPKQDAPTQQPVAWMVGLEVFDTLTEAKLNIRNPELTPEPLYRTPAAANAALTDEQIQEAVNKAVKRGELSWNDYRKDLDGKYTIPNLAPYHFQFARAILAAAGPDAALVALIHKAQSILACHLPPDGPDAKTTISVLLGLLDGPESRAALSGAKGN